MADFVISTEISAKNTASKALAEASSALTETAKTMRSVLPAAKRMAEAQKTAAEAAEEQKDAQKKANKANKTIKQSLKSASRAVSNFAKRLKSAATSVFNFAKGAFGYAKNVFGYAKQVYDFVSGQADALEELGKFAETNSISLKGLQEWETVAKSAGVTTDELRDGLSELHLRVGQLRAGEKGGIFEAFGRIAPDVVKSVKAAKTLDEQFDIVVKAIREVDDTARQMEIADKVFGGEAAKQILRVINLTDEEIRAQKKLAREKGLATEDEIKQVVAFKESQRQLERQIDSVKQAIAMELMPHIRALLIELSGWISRNKELITSKVKDFVLEVVEGVKDFVKWLSEVDWSELWEEIKDTAKIIKDLVDDVGGLKNALLLLGGAKVLTSIASLTGAFGGLGATIGGIVAIGAAAGFVIDDIMTKQGVTSAVRTINEDLPDEHQQERTDLETSFDDPDRLKLDDLRSDALGGAYHPVLAPAAVGIANTAGWLRDKFAKTRTVSPMLDVKAAMATAPPKPPKPWWEAWRENGGQREQVGGEGKGKVDLNINVTGPPGTQVDTQAKGDVSPKTTQKSTGRRTTVGAKR